MLSINHNRLIKHTICESIIAAFVGIMVVTLPLVLRGNCNRHHSGFFPVVRDSIEYMEFYSVGLLFLLGLLLGLFGRGRFWIIGMCTMLAFPLWSIIDMLAGGDHNLFPLEWLIYGIMSFVGLFGSALGRGAKVLLQKKSEKGVSDKR